MNIELLSMLEPEGTHTNTEMKIQEFPFNKLRKTEKRLQCSRNEDEY